MKKLAPPTCCPSELFDECVQAIADPALQERLLAQKELVLGENGKYNQHSTAQTWCTLPRATHGNADQNVIGNLTKAELILLYTDGMVKADGAARKKYDEIKLLAHDECPYCGGCGELVEIEGIGTLDHFLPKAYFPAFSITPENLIPACATCNSGMGGAFPTSLNLQPLHPYFDAPHFFDEKWTTVTVSEDEPVIVTFDVAPPATWSDQDKERVREHFKNCKLGGRYRAKVASDLSSVIEQRKSVHRRLSAQEFRDVLMTVANNAVLPVNGWKRSLHFGLAESDWFCNHEF